MWNLLGYVEKNKRIPYDSSRGKYLLFISYVHKNSDTFEISNRMYSFFFADGDLKPLWRAVSKQYGFWSNRICFRLDEGPICVKKSLRFQKCPDLNSCGQSLKSPKMAQPWESEMKL